MQKKVVITGVQSGIGYASAQVFSENGWYVIGIGRRSCSDSQYINQYILADVSEESCWKELFNEILEKEESIYSIVNNAGVQICKPIIETSSEEWDFVMSTNIKSVFYSVKYLSPLMSNGGSIINVSSVHAMATSKNIGVCI